MQSLYNKFNNVRDSDLPQQLAVTGCCLLGIAYYGVNYVLKFGLDISPEFTSLIVYLFLGGKIVLTRYSRSDIVKMAVAVALGLLALYWWRDTVILTSVVVLISLKDVDMGRLLKPLFWCALASSLMLAVLSYMGIGEDFVIIKDYSRGGVETRYAFGFGHPNQAHLHFTQLCCMFSLAYYDKMRLPHFVGMAALNLILYHFTISRTGMISVFILIAMLVLYRYLTRVVHSKAWGYLVIAGAAAFIVFAFWSVWEYGEIDILDSLNSMLTGRLKLAGEALDTYPVTWLGLGASCGVSCDHGYIYMLISEGILYTALYLGAMMTCLIYAVRKKQDAAVILILVFLLYGYTESAAIIKVIRNVPMIFSAWLIFGQNHAVKLYDVSGSEISNAEDA